MLLESLVDRFDFFDEDKWLKYGDESLVRVEEGRLIIESRETSIYSGIESVDTFDLTDSYGFIRLVSFDRDDIESLEVTPLIVRNDSQNQVFFNLSPFDSTISAIKDDDGIRTTVDSDTFSPDIHRWFKIREDSGIIFYDYSADGQSWSNFASTTVSWSYTSIKALAEVGTWQAEAETASTVYDDFNLEPLPPESESPKQKFYQFVVSDSNQNPFGVWSNQVVTEFNYHQEINNAGSAVDLTLSRNPDTVGEGTDVFLNHNVDVIAFYGDLSPWVNHNGDQYVNQDGEEYSFAFGSPNGRRIFSGYISRYIPNYGDNTVDVTLLGHGAELDNHIIEIGAGTTVEQDEFNTTRSFGNIGAPFNTRKIAQSFQTTNPFSVLSVQVEIALTSLFAGQTVLARVELWTGDAPGSGELIGTTTRSIISTSFQEYTFVFNPSVEVQDNEDYHIQIMPDNLEVSPGADSYPFSIRVDDTDPYADGSFWREYDDAGFTWEEEGGTDLKFRINTEGGDTRSVFNSFDPSDILRAIISNYRAFGGRLNFTPTSIDTTATTVSYTFNVNSTLEGVQKVLELAPFDWYWTVDQAQNLVVFRRRGETPEHIFILGKEIINLRLEHTLEGLVNTVYISGGEVGDPPENLFRRYRDNESINEWRRGLEKISDGRLTVPSTMDIMAEGSIARNKNPRFRTNLVISAQKYNIENIRVGDIVGFRGFDNFINDLTLQVVGLVYTPDSVNLQLDSLLPRVSKRIEDLRRQLAQVQNENNPDAPE